MKQKTDADAIKATQTNADVHGSTLIKPGDKVFTNNGCYRVVETHPNKGKVTVYGDSIGNKVEKIFTADIIGYESRATNCGEVMDL